MKKGILLLSAVLLQLVSWGQVRVTGTIIDAADNSPMPGVNVLLMQTSDTTQQTGVATDINGAFELINVQPGTYRLKTIYLSYKNYNRAITISNEDLALGTIKLQSATTQLKGVEIETMQTRVEQKGDTTQFNANSYKTHKDASAEDLVTKMPGVTSENGTLKVHGEDVKKVLVDGKPFFGDDPNAALKNLPADMIDKVQVFDKLSDQAQFTGFNDGNTSKTINIVTKQGMTNGTFGKVYAGYGTDDRYIAGLSLNIFKGERKITLLGLTNNINQQNFTTQEGMSAMSMRGGMRGMGGGGYGRGGGGDMNFMPTQSGITTTTSAGINYSDAWGKKVKASGSYFFNTTDNDNSTTLTRTYISSSDSGLTYNEESVSTTQGMNNRVNFRLEYTPDTMNSIILTPNLNYSTNRSNASVLARTVTSENIESASNNINTSDGSNYTFSNDLLLMHRFVKRGRTISVNFSTQLNANNSDGSLISTTTSASGNDTSLTDQQSKLANDGSTYSGTLSYTEPIGKVSQLMFTYTPSYTSNHSDKQTYNFDDDTQTYSLPDTSLTNKFDNTYITHRGGVSYRINNEKINASFGVNYQDASLDGKQVYPSAFTVSRRFTSILPIGMFRYKFSPKKSLHIFYRSNNNAPSVTQLQNVIDNSNPLLLKTGNPSLKQDYSHNFFARYASSNSDKGTSFFFMMGGGVTQDYIGTATIIATQDTVVRDNIFLHAGSQLSYPVNLDGYYNARSFLVYARPIKKLKSNLNLSTGATFSSKPGMINNELNRAGTYAITQGISLVSNISQKLDFTLSYSGSYNIVKNTLQTGSDNNYFQHTASAKVNWVIWKELAVNSNLTHTLYSGLTQGFNQDFLLWNASLGYKFLKSKSLEAKVSVFDLLDQNQSITRNVTETYIEDSETNILQRYLMFTLTWNIKKFGAGNNGTIPPDPGTTPPDKKWKGSGNWNGQTH